jgi:hypothetical protein
MATSVENDGVVDAARGLIVANEIAGSQLTGQPAHQTVFVESVATVTMYTCSHLAQSNVRISTPAAPREMRLSAIPDSQSGQRGSSESAIGVREEE